MEINVELYASKEEFFNFLTLSILQDIKQSTNKDLAKEEIINSYSYQKKLRNKVGREGDVNVKIMAFEPNEKYIARFKGNQGENIISYIVTDINDAKINVNYKEQYIEADKIKGLNYKIVNFFYNKKAEKKARKMIKQIEYYIEKNRKLEANS